MTWNIVENFDLVPMISFESDGGSERSENGREEQEMPKGVPPVDGMPSELKAIYSALWQEVGNLHLNWIAFCQVYGKGPELIKLLQRFGALFWSQVQQALFSDIILRICHLTDPAEIQKGRYKNQSLPRLISEVEAIDVSLIDNLGLRKKLGRLQGDCKDIRTMRNKAIAHRSWDSPVKPLPSTTRKQIEAVVALIIDIMNTVELYFADKTTIYGFDRNPGDAEYLMERLEDFARRLDAERQERGLR